MVELQCDNRDMKVCDWKFFLSWYSWFCLCIVNRPVVLGSMTTAKTRQCVGPMVPTWFIYIRIQIFLLYATCGCRKSNSQLVLQLGMFHIFVYLIVSQINLIFIQHFDLRPPHVFFVNLSFSVILTFNICHFTCSGCKSLKTRLATVAFLDGYSSTVQGLLDWFEVNLGFTELLFIQIDLCVKCFFVLYSPLLLSSCPFWDILHCLPRVEGVPLESALNLVGRMSSCGTHATHIAVLWVKITCSICYDRADDSSIHRGTYHILEST